MKRKTSTTPTKIWSFGALEPLENKELFGEQLFQSKRYYNQLIEIEHKRRAAFRTARSEALPELGQLEDKWRELDERYAAGIAALPTEPMVVTPGKKPRKAARKPTPELLTLKQERAEVGKRLKDLRAEFSADTRLKSTLKHVYEEAKVAIKAARASTPVYWGTYLLIEKQVEQARKSELDPRFRSFQGEGRVGVQLQGGLTVAELMSGTDTRLQLVPRQQVMPNGHVIHGIRRRTLMPHDIGPRKWAVRIRIGSGDNREPIWATLPIVYHRDLPDDAVIKWAWIKVRSNAGERRYELQLALESETFREEDCGSGVCAINFGWRANENGSRRVAYLVDDQGREESLDTPVSDEWRRDKARSLRSIRDLVFEEAKRNVMAHMALHGASGWLREETRHIAQWRNSKHLTKIARRLAEEQPETHALAVKWRRERLSATPKLDLFDKAPVIMQWCGNSGDKFLALYLELWRAKNQHLWHWENTLRDRAKAHRNDVFRCWARKVQRRYAEIRIEDFDLREMARTPQPEEEQTDKSFRRNRAAAAPGELRSYLIGIAKSKVFIRKAHGNTIQCHLCDHTNERVSTHQMTCSGCGATYDQDGNNCRNQLQKTKDPIAAE